MNCWCPTYTLPKLGQNCVCRFPGTKKCQDTNRHNSQFQVRFSWWSNIIQNDPLNVPKSMPIKIPAVISATWHEYHPVLNKNIFINHWQIKTMNTPHLFLFFLRWIHCRLSWHQHVPFVNYLNLDEITRLLWKLPIHVSPSTIIHVSYHGNTVSLLKGGIVHIVLW